MKKNKNSEKIENFLESIFCRTLHRATYLLSVMGGLESISELNMAKCGLTEIPKVIQSYLDLTKVDLSHNAISEIDGSIFNQVGDHPRFKIQSLNLLQFRYVSNLNLSHNKLTKIPKVSKINVTFTFSTRVRMILIFFDAIIW